MICKISLPHGQELEIVLPEGADVTVDNESRRVKTKRLDPEIRMDIVLGVVNKNRDVKVWNVRKFLYVYSKDRTPGVEFSFELMKKLLRHMHDVGKMYVRKGSRDGKKRLLFSLPEICGNVFDPESKTWSSISGRENGSRDKPKENLSPNDDHKNGVKK